jgi:ABC-2 type transport system ATP-binding protein
LIEIESVSKTFGNLKAVDRVSFATQTGEIFGLLGPNGAGKTTIIRMIMNILAPDSGEIRFDGRKLTEEDKSRIGYLPEERGLYKKEKVCQMLSYLADLKGADPKQSQANIDRWLERFDILDWKDRKIEDLSKGMSQKVQFIAAVAHDPELLFFDEPFSGLDPVSADMLRDSIQELGREGKTVLFSTHIMEHAEKICKRIFLINKGRELVQGGMNDLKNRYGSRTVIIEFDGDDSVIKDLPAVKSIIRYPRYIELELEERGNPDEVLASIVGRVSIRRFEISSPSLHSIFIRLVGGKEEADV